jgi:hypothetical protein
MGDQIPDVASATKSDAYYDALLRGEFGQDKAVVVSTKQDVRSLIQSLCVTPCNLLAKRTERTRPHCFIRLVCTVLLITPNPMSSRA